MAFHKARALREAEKSLAQGKTAQAIKLYQEILDKDPSDVSLLNTIGDLYIRDRNVAEGLRQFHRLAEAYLREGFNVKAVAIYRKIAKLDPSSIDTLLKLAELYQLQGLNREAREQYQQAVEFFKKRSQTDRVLEVLRKLAQLDPENVSAHHRLAEACEQSGRRVEAAQAYLEAGEILLRRNDQGAAEATLKKAAEHDPSNSRIQILRARVALSHGQAREAEAIITASPQLQADPAGRQLLLHAYLHARKLAEAENLVLDVFEKDPQDFTPVAGVCSLMLDEGEVDKAYKLLASVSEAMINLNNAAPLVAALRGLWTKAPDHIPALELTHRVCERTADELTLPDVLEALGHAHENSGDLEKAEAAYFKLTEREPENESYRGLLNSVREKLGKVSKPADFSNQVQALQMEEEASASAPAEVDAEEASMVREALENSDLYARYNVPEKAIAELEKVLQTYPDQIEVHRRILEISRKGFPERGAAAAAQLARIYAERGDAETSNKYHAIASSGGQEIPLPPSGNKVEEPAAAPAAASGPPQVQEAPASEPFAPSAFPLAPQPLIEDSPAEATPEPALFDASPTEVDLSEDLDAISTLDSDASTVPFPESQPGVRAEEPAAEVEAWGEPKTTGGGDAGAVPEADTGPQDLEDSRIEVQFYLENGFKEEAARALAALEEKYPGNAIVAELRRTLDAQAAPQPAAQPAEQVREETAPTPAESPDAENLDAASPDAAASIDATSVDAASMDAAGVDATSVDAASVDATSVDAVPTPAPQDAADPLATEDDWELPADFARRPATEESAVTNAVELPSAADGEPAANPVEFRPEVEVLAEADPHTTGLEGSSEEEGGVAPFGELAAHLAPALEESADATGQYPRILASAAGPAGLPATGPGDGASQLNGLLAELEDPGAAAARDERETHYNLGVAFREMGLLDESIGEFQKVVRGAGKNGYPPQFLQACSLLAICFMEKKMPAIAVKWYLRALETPDLDEDAMLALQYDLGAAYEQCGDARNALERFIEVYSQNIDFRDVAEKIRELQQKA